MRCGLSIVTIFLLGMTPRAQAQDLGSVATRVVLPGITFNLALNEAEKHVKVADARLTLSSPAKRDNFRDPNGKLSNNTAPMLLSEVDNTKPFTFTAKVTPTFLDTYDAGALYIWARDDLWLKMAMERDERGRTRLVTVRTIGTSDDNNHDVVTAKSVYMKISSDVTTVGFYYSLDNQEWQLIRLFKNEYPDTIWLGVSSQSPVGAGNASMFENVVLTQTSISNFRLGK
jgi:regulation of enolase protein 1 (concanavalin A-like superfamily)